MRKSLPLLLPLAAVLLLSGSSLGRDLILQWKENSEPDLATGGNPRYKIYYKTGTSGMGQKSVYVGLPNNEPEIADEGSTPILVTAAMDENPDRKIVQFTLHGMDDKARYYAAVTALDNSGNESELSKEAWWEVPAPAKNGRLSWEEIEPEPEPEPDPIPWYCQRWPWMCR